MAEDRNEPPFYLLVKTFKQATNMNLKFKKATGPTGQSELDYYLIFSTFLPCAHKKFQFARKQYLASSVPLLDIDLNPF